MTKEEARKKTIRKFTKLIDGSTLPNISPGQVVDYYQSLLNDQKPNVKMPIGGIESNFREEEIKDDEFYMRNGFTRR